MTTFSTLTVRNWRQFRSVKIDVHPRATIITGANGAGKSTILGIFGQHMGFHRPLLGTPNKRTGGGWGYDSGFFDVDEEERKHDEPFLPFSAPTPPIGMPPSLVQGVPARHKDVGRLVYANGIVASLSAPQDSNQYGLNIIPAQQVPGVYVSSHRIVAPYLQVSNLSLQVNQPVQVYANYQSELSARYNGQNTGSSPLFRMKEAILSMSAFGQGNEHFEGNPLLIAITKEFEAALRIMLPDELLFERFAIRMPDIVLKTGSGEFTVDASSGGISAILELTWQILMFEKTQLPGTGFVVVMDEPENHLHPSMQRTLLPKLLKAFPIIQFIVATHSPFVVSSVENSNVYALQYRPVLLSTDLTSNTAVDRVVALPLRRYVKAGSATEILREVLGVPVTFPDWANDRVEAIVQELSGGPINKSTVAHLRKQLADAGLEDQYPNALEELIRRND